MVDKQQEIFKKRKDLFLPHGFKNKLLEDLLKKFFFGDSGGIETHD